MSDQFGSFDNPYGGKPPFQGQEPPPPTPYAEPQPYAAPQPTQAQQPQGWGHAPPAYLHPQYPQPDPEVRPGTVVAASVMTIVGSVIALLMSVLMVPAGLADYNDPTSSDKGLTLWMVIWFAVCGVLSLIAIPLGIMLLFRSKIARVLTAVVGSFAAFISLFTVVYPALIISVLVMLYAGRAGNWFARRTPGDPLQLAAVPGVTPPTHQQF